MNEIKIINPFFDITPIETLSGASNSTDQETFSMGGGGANGIKADQQGMWFGARKFADAPFSVDMSGFVVATGLTLTGGILKSGKTSFTDATNPGYFISPLGIYFGSSSDATRLKYTVATGVLDYIGTVSGRSSATLASAISATGEAQAVANGIITTVKLALGAVTEAVVAAGAITENKLYTGAVTADKIAANTITAAKIASHTITASQIAANTITATEMYVSTLSAISANLGTVTSGTITGALLQTSASDYTGVKISGALGGVVLYGQSLEVRDTSNTLYGSIGGYAGYFNITAVSGRNMLIGSPSATVIFNSDIAPIYTNTANIGNTSYRWGNVFTSNLDFGGGSYYMNLVSGKIQSNSDFRIAGSIYFTGNMIMENYASITAKDSGGNQRTLTCQYNATLAKYILSS